MKIFMINIEKKIKENFTNNSVIGGILLGVGVIITGYTIASFAKEMINKGRPEVAKLPLKALDEMTQQTHSPEYGKVAVSIMTKLAENEIDYQNAERR